jgi:hypothetical protein
MSDSPTPVTPVETEVAAPKIVTVENLMDYGSFEIYTPEPGEYPTGYDNAPEGIQFYRNENGEDYYDLIQATGETKTDCTYVYVRLPENIVLQAINDDTDIVPPKRTYLGSPVIGISLKVLSFDMVTDELTGATWDGEDTFTLSPSVLAIGTGDPVVPDAPVTPTFPTISKRQFAQGLWELKVFSYQESQDFITVSKIPPALEAILETLPDDDTGAPTPRKLATFLLQGATEYSRDNSLVEVVRQQQNPEMTVQDLDDYWRYWATL